MVEPGMAKILFQLGTYGPLGVMVVLLFILLLRCQKECREIRAESSACQAEMREENTDLAGKLVELSRESIKADTEHAEALRAHTKVLDSIDRRLA